MPALTIYLSRLIGVVALIIAAAMLAGKPVVVAAFEQLGQDRGSLMLLGFVRVVFGAAIVLLHNVWTRGFWPLVVTLTGWTILVRGVMNLFLPPEAMATVVAASHVVDFYYVYAAVPLLLGGYLSLRGFVAAAPAIEIIGTPAASPAPQLLQSKPRPRRRR